MLTIIGDVHGKFDEYLEITKKHDRTFQLGDFGFQYTLDQYKKAGIDPRKHKFGQGNHDQHDTLLTEPGFCGRWGFLENEVFWIGGGYSIDQRERVFNYPGTYFENEELSLEEMMECLDSMNTFHPEVIVSHEAPSFLRDLIHDNSDILVRYGLPANFRSNTSIFLNSILKRHRPKLWVFGHHHKSFRYYERGCTFIGLAELETFTIGV